MTRVAQSNVRHFTTRFDSSTLVLVCGLVAVLVRSLFYYDGDW